MSYTVYVMKDRHHRIYIGQTQNIDERIAEHQTGSTRSTRNRGPYRLVYSEQYNTRIEAIHRETALKSGQGRAWLKAKLGERPP